MASLPNQSDNFGRDPGELPESLLSDLRATYGRTVPVPTAVDAAVLREARTGFARRRRFRLAVRGALVTAAAAAVALAVAIPAWMTSDAEKQRQAVAPVPATTTPMLMVAGPGPSEDVDHNGKVDILDAFTVAKLIEVRGELDRSYDVNGDGKVDQSDVDRVALVAVDTTDVADERGVQ